MDFEDAVVVASFSDHATAEAAVSLLRSEGLIAELTADDAGGELPNLDLTGPVRVWVRPEDAEFATQLLNAGERSE